MWHMKKCLPSLRVQRLQSHAYLTLREAREYASWTVLRLHYLRSMHVCKALKSSAHQDFGPYGHCDDLNRHLDVLCSQASCLANHIPQFEKMPEFLV